MSTDDEVERLRHAAFARGAGEAEVRAYREALERREPEAQDAAQDAPHDPPQVGRPWVLAVIAAALALVVGGGVGWWLGSTGRVTPVSDPSALDRWHELPEATSPLEDDSIRDADSRFLGDLDGVRFIGTVGTGTEGFHGGQAVVCLAVEFGEERAAGSCTTRDLFEQHGIWLASSGPDGSFIWFWEADRPPAEVPCAPDNWLRTCPGRMG